MVFKKIAIFFVLMGLLGTSCQKLDKNLGQNNPNLEGDRDKLKVGDKPKDELFDSKTVSLLPLKYNGKPSSIYGDANLSISSLYANKTMKNASFPNILVLASTLKAGQAGKHFSITAEISKDHFFVIIAPQVRNSQVSLYPGFLLANKSINESEVTTKLQIFSDFLGSDYNTGHQLDISWSINSKKIVQDQKYELPVVKKDKDYSIIAHVLGENSERIKSYYYFCPTDSFLQKLKSQFGSVGGPTEGKEFTLESLYEFLVKQPDSEINLKILDEIKNLRTQSLTNFF